MSNISLEKVIVNQIIKALKAHGITWVIKMHGGPYQVANTCFNPKSEYKGPCPSKSEKGKEAIEKDRRNIKECME